MAIYNIDNIRSINEDKSDIARYDELAKERAAEDSENGHKLKSDGVSSRADRRKIYKEYLDQDGTKYKRSIVAARTDPFYTSQTASLKKDYDRINNNYTKDYSDIHKTFGLFDKARIKRRLKKSKAKQAKLKEAAQYILDVLDEQEYYNDYNEYDNSDGSHFFL